MRATSADLDRLEAEHGVNIEASDFSGNTHVYAYTDDDVQFAVELFGMNPDTDDVNTAAATIAALRGLANKRPRVGVIWPAIEGGVIDVPDQWTRMSVEGPRLTVTVRVGGRHVDLVFEGHDLDDLQTHAAAAVGNRPAPAPADPLTPKECAALGWLAAGLSNKLIADRMSISHSTAKFHVQNILKKLRAENRTHAVAIAASMGYVGGRDGLRSVG